MGKTKIFSPGIVPPKSHRGPAWWFVFRGRRLLVKPNASSLGIPSLADFDSLALTSVRRLYLGEYGNRHCFAVEVVDGTEPPAGMFFQGLRQVGLLVDESLFSLAGHALQILDWDRVHRFCSQCGRPVEVRTAERAKECTHCNLLYFPRLSPAIIVRVTRGRELLLARSSRFPSGMYSVLAGFVEPGETLEQAVEREVHEEVGLTIKDIHYFGSQPWPFPNSLMVGFTAVYAHGEITLNDPEIEEAGWFRVEDLPPLPSRISIARKLIDSFLRSQSRKSNHDGKQSTEQPGSLSEHADSRAVRRRMKTDKNYES